MHFRKHKWSYELFENILNKFNNTLFYISVF